MATKAEQFAKQQDMLQKAWVDVNKYNAAIAWGSSVEDALKAGWYAWQKAQPASQATYDASQHKSNQIIQQKQDNLNQLNAMSQTAAQANSRDFQVGTWDVAEMPQQQQSVSQGRADSLAKSWSNLTYEQQQDRLSRTAWLKDALAKRGITVKTQPTQTTQPKTTTQQRTTQPQTPKQEQWDYQDNSQARMDQIADNLDKYRQTMPQLFDDWTAFYNFFIKDKGRSQDQIDFLWDYFNRAQKYGKYDNMSPEQLWTWIANWDIPWEYLNTLKTTDPQKYQEVMAAKQNREDTIKNESFLNDAATMAWIEWWESANVYPQQIEWAWEQWLWVDEDENRVDDRRENYATEEEKWYQKQIADLNAANLDIDNTVKHTYDDYVKKYPWATKATLMAMAQDANADLLREKENNLVELTRLQGYVWYMQAERQEMNKAGADSIAQLQKNIWMYYDYSPQWMAERAQAQYAATNVTLDQADSGNETQKQMALQSVLDDYYAKYGSIIQRSEQQVINDVIAYAKKNWVWLAQALQENFVKPLQQKPQFATLSTGWSLTADKWAKLNDNTLYNVTTWETISTDWWNVSVTTSRWETITPISAASNSETTNNLMSKYPIWSSYKNWECWELMNLDASSSGSNIHFWSNLSEKTKWINRETYEWPKIWAYVVFDWSNKPWASEKMQKYWHVWKVVWMWDWYIDIRNQNGSKSWQITVDRYPLKDYEKYIAWYVDPTKTEDYWYWGSPLDDQFAAIQNASSKLNKDQKEALDFADSAYMMMYKLASNWDLDYFLKSPDWQKVLSNYAAAQFSNNANYTEDQILSTLKNNVTDQRVLWIVNDLMTIIEKKLRWTSWAAISGSEWNSNSKMLIPQAWESYDTQFRKFQTFEWEYLKKPFETMWRYAWVNTNYIPLFTWNSPYYTKYAVSAEQEADDAI